VSRSRLARLASVATGALLATMLLAPSLTSANTPAWNFDGTTALGPATIKVGGSDAWHVVINNPGPSNISALYLTTDISASPAFVGNVTYSYSGGPANPCSAAGAGKLVCSFGALPALGQIQIDAVAYQITASNFSFNFELLGNGNTPSDKGHKSHGDTKLFPVTVATSTSGDYAGSWTLDTSVLNTDQTVGRNNVQGTTVRPPSTHIPVSVDDSGTISFDCSASANCGHAFGVWTDLHVNNAADYSSSPFQVTLLLYGKSIPNGVQLSDIKVIHVLDNVGGTETLTQTANACPSDPSTTTADCIASVTKVGQNVQVVLWLIQNGGLRGSY
jgi:hypothetical protein